MASSLELAKLITAGYLYNYWEKINKSFRIYLSGAVVILVLITSLGIYGFLTSAFQDTFNQFSIKEKQLAFLQQKEKFWEDDVARYDVELGRISQNISTLSNAKATGIQVRDTSSSTGFRNTISTTELRLSQKRIGVEEENRKGVQSKREVASDSLQSIQIKILDLESMEGVSSELGPLEYLSGLLDRPMDVIINWFILIIIFVFDPLAVALVIAFNNAVLVDRGIVDKRKVVAKRELYGEDDDSDELYEEEEEWANDEDVKDFLEREDSYEVEEDDKLFTVAGMTNDKEQSFNEFQKKQDEFDEEILPDEARGFAPPTSEDPLLDYDEEDEKRMNIVGQNGNDGEHYDELPLDTTPDPKPKDIDKEEDWEIAFESDKRVAEILQKTPSKRRVRFMDGTEGWINRSSGSDDDNTISYM